MVIDACPSRVLDHERELVFILEHFLRSRVSWPAGARGQLVKHFGVAVKQNGRQIGLFED